MNRYSKKDPKILIYWHIWFGKDLKRGISIVKRQYLLLKKSNLLYNAYSINVSINPKHKFILDKIFGNDNKFFFNSYQDNIDESFTLEALFKDIKKSENDLKILYFHSRGASIENSNPRSQCSDYWTKMLEHFCILNWKNALIKLKKYHTCGCEMYPHYGEHYLTNKNLVKKIWHYSGNFWWANSNYIKNNLNNPYSYKSNDFKANRYVCGEDWLLSSIGNKSRPKDHFILHRTNYKYKKTPFNIYTNRYSSSYYANANLIPKKPLNPFKYNLDCNYIPIFSEKKYLFTGLLFLIFMPFIKCIRIARIYKN